MMNSCDINALRSELGAVEQRVYDKYAVSRRDARLAVDYLSCFLAVKSGNPHAEIILPQIADWAWHELILDTASYRQLCARLFGSFLDHAFKPVPPGKITLEHHLRQTFSRSLAIFKFTYGLGTGDRAEEWCEAGWDRPRYRLRRDLSTEKANHLIVVFGSAERLTESLFEWLPQRLGQRFGLTRETAFLAVRDYAQAFSSSSLNSPFKKCSAMMQIAWEEHILWTQRYADDCDRHLGRFLDHAPITPLTELSAPAAR